MAIEEKFAQLDTQLLDTDRSLLQARTENATLSKQLTDATTAKVEADGQILSLQSSFKQTNDEIERLKKLLADMTSVKNAGDARISMLEGQGKVDTDKIASLGERVSELEATLQRAEEEATNWETECKRNVAELASMTKNHADVSASGAAAMAVAEKSIAEWETTCKNKDIELASLTDQQTNLKASSAAAKSVGDKVIETLKNQLSALQTSSSQSIADLQARLNTSDKETSKLQSQLKSINDELSNLTRKYAELTSIKAAADDQIVALTAQGKRDALEFDRTKRQLISAVSVLDGDIDQLKEQLREITEEFEAANNLAEERTCSKEAEVASLQRLLASKDAAIDSAVKKLGKIQALQNEKDILSQRIETLSGDLHTLRDERTSALNEHQRLNILVASLESQLKAEKADKEVTLRKRDAAAQGMVSTLSRIEAQLSLVRQQLDERTEEKESLIRTHHEKMAEFELMRSQLVSLQNNRTQMDRNLLDIHHKLIATEAAEQNASRHAVECEGELVRLRAELEGIAETLRKSQAECAEKDNNIAVCSSSLEALRASNTALQGRIVELLAANEQYVLAAELGSLKHAASLEDHVALSSAKDKAHKDQILQLEM